MTDQDKNSLERPESIRDADDQRRDGRPTDDSLDTDPRGGDDSGATTIAPEERGGSPSTEHGPGADL